MRFNEKLRKQRKDLGLKQSEVAEQILVGTRTISTWELGENCPSTELLIALVKLYGASLDELLSEEIAETQQESIDVQSVFLELPFHEKLLMLRRHTGMTQGEMAERLNVSAGSLGRWESGSKMPSIDYLIKISKFFGIPIDELLYAELL